MEYQVVLTELPLCSLGRRGGREGRGVCGKETIAATEDILTCFGATPLYIDEEAQPQKRVFRGASQLHVAVSTFGGMFCGASSQDVFSVLYGLFHLALHPLLVSATRSEQTEPVEMTLKHANLKHLH